MQYLYSDVTFANREQGGFEPEITINPVCFARKSGNFVPVK
jgi:hypothetical protein